MTTSQMKTWMRALRIPWTVLTLAADMNRKWCDLNGGTILVVRFLSMKRSSMYRIPWMARCEHCPIEEVD